MQLDQSEKGFSFSKEGPLDMRMDPTSSLTADEIVNRWNEKDLGALFRDFGEEPRWRQAAKAIVDARKKEPIKTTTQLSAILSSVIRGKKKLHPATLVFQALRICVNHELDAIQEGLMKAMSMLRPGGRMGVISFHRLEDRIVKNLFREAALPLERRKEEIAVQMPLLKILTKKPLCPSLQEVRMNPRSRSAKMRFAEKI